MIINRLPDLLTQREMSIRELSRLTGVTYTTIRAIYHMERRSIQFGILESICRVLDVQPGDIYSFRSTSRDVELQKKVEKPLPAKEASQEPAQSVTSSTSVQPPNDWRAW